LEFWSNEPGISKIQQHKNEEGRNEVKELLDELRSKKIIDDRDHGENEEYNKIYSTKRKNFNVAPGLSFIYRIRFNDIKGRDDPLSPNELSAFALSVFRKALEAAGATEEELQNSYLNF